MSEYGRDYRDRGGRDRGYRDRPDHRDRDYRDRDRDRGHGGGAGHLARIHGTEEDRVNCPFYFKIGACRHGERCSRVHNKPVFSQTVLLPHMYQNPLAAEMATKGHADIPKGYYDQPQSDDFDDFFIEAFEELSKYGEIEEIVVCENLGDHLLGNVYIKYYDEEDANKCLEAVKGRFYGGRQLHCEFSPVTDFREARCRQYHDNTCTRSGDCNFIHTKRVDRRLMADLNKHQKYSGKYSRPETYRGDSSDSDSGSSSGSGSSSDSNSDREGSGKNKPR